MNTIYFDEKHMNNQGKDENIISYNLLEDVNYCNFNVGNNKEESNYNSFYSTSLDNANINLKI